MKFLPQFSLIVILLAVNFVAGKTEASHYGTFCNPINIDYRFEIDEPSRRTAADPVILLYKNNYYLFASKSGGYWFSNDMSEWTFVESRDLPVENPAPAILILGDKMYYTAHRLKEIYESEDPKKGVWRKVADIAEYADPAFFQDDDDRVYLYYGASFNGGISVVEIDPKNNFKTVSEPVRLMSANFKEHGWEGAGEDNLGYLRNGVNRVEPWIEGPWMTKHNGVYYLQYSAPGTIWKAYADGVYTSRFPNKDFVYQSYSPFSYKPGGFIGSAGHAATFRDKHGNYWRVVTMVISVAHKFERRLGIFPAGFDPDGVMRTNTYLGDYPQFLPGAVKTPLDNNLTGWMLLSFGKDVAASSAFENHPAENAFDEDIRTGWSGKTGDKGEWLRVDLGSVSLINAVQANFAEHDTKTFGRTTKIYQRYTIETSADGRKWTLLIDKSRNSQDAPHDYIELKTAQKARYLRLTNILTPAGGKFAVRDLRVFGKSNLPKPEEVKTFTVHRDKKDTRKAVLRWQPAKNASNYIVRFGVSPKKLYNNYQVVKGNSLVMNGLNKNAEYYFSVDAAGESGVTKGKIVVSAEN
ncbi:MAG: family 43 glycosylhydrolase [Pyrinomonadaceae bacterium]